jgi:hypothetical protein
MSGSNANIGLYRAGDGTGPDVAAALSRKGGQPDEAPGKQIVIQRAQEWNENHILWMRMLDSYEGGQRYRNATYGADRKGLPARNLFRHRREYPDPQQFPSVFQGYAGNAGNTGSSSIDVGYGPYPGMLGSDPATTAQDDVYELRRSRTPVPEFVAEAVEIHLSKIYDQEVSRDGPAELIEWWEDVDGRGTPIDDYMQETIAPLLMVCGCLDIAIDRPRLPKGAKAPQSEQEVIDYGLDKCIASHILPENVVWWITDYAGRYVECLVKEWLNDGAASRKADMDDKKSDAMGPEYRRKYEHWRHWTLKKWTLYNFDGSEVLDSGKNPYPHIPIQRLVDKPRHRQPMVGKSRYEMIAEIQREYYNRDSELILSDTIQAHPLLSGPEIFCKADSTISVGPGYVLPKARNNENGQHEGWEYVSPPKDPAESLRKNKQDLVDLKDRRAALTKPAGAAAGSNGGTVGQSGISKQLDAVDGNKILTSIAKSLAKAERMIAERAYCCLTGKPLSKEIRDSIEVTYPTRFNLFSADEIADITTKVQQIASMAGSLPIIEGTLIEMIIKAAMTGMEDEDYEAFKLEIETLMEAKSAITEQRHELAVAGIQSAAESLQGSGSEEQQGGEDPSGQSGGTMVGNTLPATL